MAHKIEDLGRKSVNLPSWSMEIDRVHLLESQAEIAGVCPSKMLRKYQDAYNRKFPHGNVQYRFLDQKWMDALKIYTEQMLKEEEAYKDSIAEERYKHLIDRIIELEERLKRYEK